MPLNTFVRHGRKRHNTGMNQLPKIGTRMASLNLVGGLAQGRGGMRAVTSWGRNCVRNKWTTGDIILSRPEKGKCTTREAILK